MFVIGWRKEILWTRDGEGLTTRDGEGIHELNPNVVIGRLLHYTENTRR